MAGPFLSGKEMYDLKKSEDTDAIEMRCCTEDYHDHTVVCGSTLPNMWRVKLLTKSS